MVDVSILIVTYNSAVQISACLNSLARQTRLAYEVILVDNASGDATLAAVKQYDGIRLIANTENIGFATAVNQASRLAQGHYLLLLNPDTLVHEGAIDGLVRFMAAHQDIGIVAPRTVNEAGEMVANTQRFHTPATLFWRPLCSSPLAALARRQLTRLNAQDQRGYAVFGCALLIRSELYRTLGGFDERFFLYEEDIDLCYRAAQAGWGVRQLTDIVVTHHGGKGSILPGEAPAQTLIRVGLQKLRSRSLYARKYFARRPVRLLHLSYAVIGISMIAMSLLHRDQVVRHRRRVVGAEYLRVGFGGLR